MTKNNFTCGSGFDEKSEVPMEPELMKEIIVSVEVGFVLKLHVTVLYTAACYL